MFEVGGSAELVEADCDESAGRDCAQRTEESEKTTRAGIRNRVSGRMRLGPAIKAMVLALSIGRVRAVEVTNLKGGEEQGLSDRRRGEMHLY